MKAIEQGLLDLLSKRNVTFFVPTYQENYNWEIEECETFLVDIIETTMSKREGHFFGTLLYYQTDTVFGQPNKLILVDGQQRLITTMLFLTALRDVINDADQEEFINETYIMNSRGNGDTAYKMKLNESAADRNTFVNIVTKEALTNDNRQNRVFENYQYFVRELENLKNTSQVKLIDLISKGLDQFKMVTIELEPEKNKWENPKTVFNSVNSVTKTLLKKYVPHFNPDNNTDIEPIAEPIEKIEDLIIEKTLIPETSMSPELFDLPERPYLPTIPAIPVFPALEPKLELEPEMVSFHPSELPVFPKIPDVPASPAVALKVTLDNETPMLKDLKTLYEEAERFANGERIGGVQSAKIKGMWRLRVIGILVLLAILVIFGILIVNLSYIFDFNLPF